MTRRSKTILPSKAPAGVEGVMITTIDKRKQSLYFPEEMLLEIQREAARQDRSLSWIVQQAWKLARDRVASIPGVNEPTPPAV
jgi:uncharacterized small protein (TIGR04563 family)